jgi:hypothetical protein
MSEINACFMEYCLSVNSECNLYYIRTFICVCKPKLNKVFFKCVISHTSKLFGIENGTIFFSFTNYFTRYGAFPENMRNNVQIYVNIIGQPVNAIAPTYYYRLRKK